MLLQLARDYTFKLNQKERTASYNKKIGLLFFILNFIILNCMPFVQITVCEKFKWKQNNNL